MEFKVGYVLEYEYQTCFDDGGLGHESWWTKTQSHLWEASTDEEAIAKAKEIMGRKPRPCDGSFCYNRGLRRNFRLTHNKVEYSRRDLTDQLKPKKTTKSVQIT